MFKFLFRSGDALYQELYLRLMAAGANGLVWRADAAPGHFPKDILGYPVLQ